MFEPTGPSPENPDAVHTAARILLVEDNELNRDMLSRRLSRKGFLVTVALDGVQALELAAETLPHLILMDMSLPVMDGWEATRQLKANPGLRHIPVIALTAHAMSDDRTKAIDAGCDDYDTKPIEFPRLLLKMGSLLGGGRAAPLNGAADAAEYVATPGTHLGRESVTNNWREQ